MIRIIAIFLLTISTAFGQFGQEPFGHVQVGVSTSSSWKPTDEVDLILYAAADNNNASADSSIVSTWIDTSGNSFDGTAAGNPYLIKNYLNGHSVIRYDGAGDYVDFTIDTTASMSIYVVRNTQPTTTAVGIMNMMSSANFDGWSMQDGTGTGTNGTTSYIGGGTTQGNLTMTSSFGGNRRFEVLSLVMSATEQEMFLDSTSIGTASQTMCFNSRLLRVGTRYNNGTLGQFQGEIAEILVFGSTHSSSKQKQVVRYLSTKYLPAMSIPEYKLQTWLIADNISGVDASAITKNWPDVSRHFGREGVLGGSPTIEVNEIGSHRAVSIGASGEYFDAKWDTSTTFTLFIVSKSQPAAALEGIATTINSTNWRGFNIMDGNASGADGFSAYVGVTAPSQITTSVYGNRAADVITFLVNGSADTLRINDVDLATASHTITFSSRTLRIGKRYTDNTSIGSWTGQISELIMYNRALSGAPYDSVYTYLTNRYGL